jgi:hypothetical protein
MPTRTPADIIQQVEEVCRALKARGDGLSWEWDGGFSAALAVAQAPQHTEVLTLLDELFTSSFDHTNIGKARGQVAPLSGQLGGLRPGQKMLSLDPEDDPLLFALWWPWGGGDRFSLRVGCNAESEAAQALDPVAVLKGCFEL